MKKQTFSLLMLLVALMFASCANEKNSGIQYVPFQETKNGMWGMVSMDDGSVLFSEEFKQEPTAVVENHFMVKNKEGLWEIYKAAEKPEKVGKEYVSATCFQNGHALVAERNQPVTIIDTEGKEVKRLDKIDGKIVEEVAKFQEGYAVFKTTEGYYGLIDTNGKTVIKAEYCAMNSVSDGKLLAIEKKFEKDVKADKKDNVKVVVLNTSGKKLFDISLAKYEDVGRRFVDGLLRVCKKIDGERVWGLLNDKGEVVLKPSAKTKEITDISGNRIVYSNGEGYGVMTLEKETVIRAKYDALWFDGDLLVAGTIKEKGSYDYSFKLINDKDEQIGTETYNRIVPFSTFSSDKTLVMVSDKDYSIIDKTGKAVEKLPDMVDVNVNTGDESVESDYVDLNAIIQDLKFTKSGLDGLTLEMQPLAAIKQVNKNGASYETDPYWHDVHSDLNYSRTVNSAPVSVTVSFPGQLSKQNYRTQRVVDYVDYYWGYTYSHNEQVPTGYTYNNITPTYIEATFSHTYKMKGKQKLLFAALRSKFASLGKIEKENAGAFIAALDAGHKVLVYKTSHSTVVMWGKASYISGWNIDRYKDNKEDMSSNSYTDDADDYEPVYADSCAVDSAVADDYYY